MKEAKQLLTCSKDLRKDTLVVRGINLIRRLSRLVLGIEQPSVLGVPQQKVGDAFTATADCHVKWVVTALAGTEKQAC